VDERILGVIPDARHESPRAPAPDWLFGGPPRPDEQPGWFHDAKVRYDLVVTDRRLVVVPVTGGAAREREAGYLARSADELVAGTGYRSIGPADVAEIVVDRQLVNVGEYSSDAATDVMLRSPLGPETRFRAINDRRTADDIVKLLQLVFGERARRARVVRHGLFRRPTRE
jgi:hypothetical protein